MAFLFWGETEESREAKKNSIESKLERILKEKGSIHLDDLTKLMWGGFNLLTDLQGILEFLNHLEKDGKIVIQDKIISPAKVSVLEDGKSKAKTVWELIHREDEIEEKKEIMRRYKQINSLI